MLIWVAYAIGLGVWVAVWLLIQLIQVQQRIHADQGAWAVRLETILKEKSTAS